MKIYIVHSSGFDYKVELYKPINQFNNSNKYEILFPHNRNSDPVLSKQIIKDCDLVIAEVSYPSTGMGIELGWADDAKIPVLCIHKQGIKPSSSLSLVFNHFVEYFDAEDLIAKLADRIPQQT